MIRFYTAVRCVSVAALAASLLIPAKAVDIPSLPEAEAPHRAAMPAVLRMRVTYQNPDEFLPWRLQAPQGRTAYCVAIAPNRFLTMEPLIRNARYIELIPAESSAKYPATIEVADIVTGLAMLRTDRNVLDADYTVTLAQDPPLEAALRCIQLDAYLRPEYVAGTVLRYAMSQAPDSPFPLLQSEILLERSVSGGGLPLVDNDGRLAGMSLIYGDSSRTLNAHTAGGLADFIARSDAQPFIKTGYAGFVWEPLLNPAHRRYLAAPEGRGVRVVATIPFSRAHGLLQPDDVILSWEEHAIDSFGFYEHPFFGRQYFTHLISDRSYPGATCRLQIWRNKEEHAVTLTLGERDDAYFLIPENTANEPAAYLSEAGFVFRELTGRYLRAYGSSWRSSANAELVHLYDTAMFAIEEPGQRIVMLTGVLPDAINVGYQHLNNLVLEEANGKRVDSLQALFRIRDEDNGIHRLKLRGIETDLFLDHQQLDEANARIQNQYGIPALRSSR